MTWVVFRLKEKHCFISPTLVRTVCAAALRWQDPYRNPPQQNTRTLIRDVCSPKSPQYYFFWCLVLLCMPGWVSLSRDWTNVTQHVLKMRIATENKEQTISRHFSTCSSVRCVFVSIVALVQGIPFSALLCNSAVCTETLSIRRSCSFSLNICDHHHLVAHEYFSFMRLKVLYVSLVCDDIIYKASLLLDVWKGFTERHQFCRCWLSNRPT